MNRTELFDKLLKHRYENQKGFCNLLTLADEQFDVDDQLMVESILEEMLDRDLVKQTNYDLFSVMINYNGKQMIENFGSYSSFLRDLNKSESKDQTKKRTDRILNNISKISAVFFGLSSFILGYNKIFIDDVEIDNQKTEIKSLNINIDSLQTELKKHTTKPYKKNAVDSPKSKG